MRLLKVLHRLSIAKGEIWSKIEVKEEFSQEIDLVIHINAIH